MLLREPDAKTLRRATSKLRFDPYTEILAAPARQSLVESLRGFDIVPNINSSINVAAIESLTRKSYIVGGNVIIHDETLSQTLTWLSSFAIRWERPLLPFVFTCNLTAELLVAQGQNELALYLSDRSIAFIDRYREGSTFSRPLNFAPQMTLDSDHGELEALMAEQLAEIEQRNELQKKITLFHELGHYIVHKSPEIRERFSSVIGELLPPDYRSIPLVVDPDFGITEIETLPADEQQRLTRQLLDNLVEEASADAVALMSLLINAHRFEPAVDDLLLAAFRFLAFSEQLEVIRYETSQRAAGRVRFQSISTRTDIRIQVFRQILLQFENVVKVLAGPAHATVLTSKVAAADFESLIRRIDLSRRVSSSLYSWSLQGPSPREPLWQERPPLGILQGLLHGRTLDFIEERYEQVFGDGFLHTMDPRTTELFEAAPNCQPICSALARIRVWTSDYFADKYAQDKYQALAAEIPKKEMFERLTRGFRAVRQRA